MFVLQGLLKAESQEKILVFLLVKKSGYAKEIADFFGVGVTPIQKQLLKMEEEKILTGNNVGKSRVFEINPQYRLKTQLETLIAGALEAYPSDIKKRLILERNKPRRTGKAANKVFE